MEKRKSQRFKIQQAVDISYNREEFFKASGINISDHGLLCETDTALDHYARIYLMIELPSSKDDDPIEVEGVVVRCDKVGKKFQVGIEFVETDASVKSVLRKLVKELQK